MEKEQFYKEKIELFQRLKNKSEYPKRIEEIIGAYKEELKAIQPI